MASCKCCRLVGCFCCNVLTSSSSNWSEDERATNSDSSLLLSWSGFGCVDGCCRVPVHLLILCLIGLLVRSVLCAVSHSFHALFRIFLHGSL